MGCEHEHACASSRSARAHVRVANLCGLYARKCEDVVECESGVLQVSQTCFLTRSVLGVDHTTAAAGSHARNLH